ncbi:dermonecrotic toxin domain-containing protein [Pseudomonas sp. R3-41]
MTLDATDTDPISDASIRGALLNQLLAGPSYPDVAAELLRRALKDLYPSLDLDPYATVLGTPDWDIIDGEIVALPTIYQSLSDLLAERADSNEPTLLIDGLHFLTQLPITVPEAYLPVRIDQIGRLINELVPAMPAASQEKQLAYWNTPFGKYAARWQEMSDTLRKIWNVKQVKGWTETECDMARQLFLHPVPADRKDKYDSHAYLVDVEAVEDGRTIRVNENSLVVLVGLIDNKEVVLTHSLLNGYERFDSRDAFERSLPSHLGDLDGMKIRWQFYEPSGNVFDSKACGLIAMQVRILGLSHAELNRALAGIEPSAFGLTTGPGESWFKHQIPEWLKQASEADQTLFAQYMKDLSALSSSHAGKTYLDDIPAIKEYASNALKAQMRSDQGTLSTPAPENIEVEIESPVVWGTFVVPFQSDTTSFNLVELALQNLIALPSGNRTVSARDGTELPEWVTVDYLENLITQVDIGRVYPQLVKTKLLDDPAESSRREKLYTEQLRVQLPLLALEAKLRGQGNIDDRGCRYVAALMETLEANRKVEGQAIVLRKLAFVPELQLGLSEDIVANMFVIGPQTSSAGPCLLYRPMLEPQLWQFPSFSNLLYAIKQTDSLRQSVLAWLPDGVRDTYGRYVFPGTLPSPWAVVDFVAAPITSVTNAGPVTLSDESLGSDFMPLLFKANADALVTLADRQSVSDSESRWASFKQAGWLILNLALPYLGTTANTAVWLWQIMNDLEQLTQNDGIAEDQVKGQAKWEIFVDLLLNVALGVVNAAIDRRKSNNRGRPTEAPETAAVKPLPEPEIGVPELKPKPVIEALAPLAQQELSQDHYDIIHTSGVLMGKARKDISLLDSFSIEAPDDPGLPESEGALKGLYQKDGHWYAKMSDKWFEVTVQTEQVNIADKTRTGPALIRDERGQWRIDSRLRLSGVGSKGVMQQVVLSAQRRNVQLLAELTTFEKQKLSNERLLTADAQAFKQASSATRAIFRDVYSRTLAEQRHYYDEALKRLMEWPVFQSRPDFPRIGVAYLDAQIHFTFAEMAVLQERFAPAMNQALSMAQSRDVVLEQQHIDAANNMIALGDDMIERLDYMETRFSELKRLGRGGVEIIRDHRATMPLYVSDDLRFLQLDMYRHLCLTLESVATMPEGWREINQLIDTAIVAAQTLHDAIDERSEIRLDEQIDALGGLTEQFTAIDEHLDYIDSEYKGSTDLQHLSRLRQRIGDLKKQALLYLAKTLDKRSDGQRSGALYKPRPGPRKKMIRARFWGLVSGEPRLSGSYEETGWVDVKNPFTSEIIATFRRKETGEWAQHIPSDTPLAVPALKTSIQKGQALIDGLPAFKAQIEKDLQQPERTPAGVAMILSAHARRLETVGVAIKKALDQVQSVVTNETVEPSAENQRLAESLRLQLKKESTALWSQEYDTVLGLIKQSPPTMSGLIWLKERKLIHITKRIARKRIKKPQKHYLDRYEIKDWKTGKALWFADFHYSTFWGPDRRFVSARLKTLEQVKSEVADVSTDGLSQRQLIEHYRSEIAYDQAIQVFFPESKS